MRKKLALLSVMALALFTVFVLLAIHPNMESQANLACLGDRKGVVDKSWSEAFTVDVVFKNTGKSAGTWSVNVAFEGASWTWTGTPMNLTLKPNESRTLSWNGFVPENAPIDSGARLIVYYGNSFVPLDWWIHVVSSSQLSINFSKVK